MDIQAVRGRLNSLSLPASNANFGTADFSQVLQQAAVKSPVSMDELFSRASRETGLPVNLLKAVAKAESDFNPNVVSSAGAMGVMQLMPSNCKEYGVSDPFDAEQNILAGSQHLRDMIDRYDGNVQLGLAAYNAGPGNVDKYGGIPPFKETQNYVPRVLKYAGQDFGVLGTVPASTKSSTSSATTAEASLSELLGVLPASSSEISIEEQAAQMCQMMRLNMSLQLSSAMASDEDPLSGNELSPDLQQFIRFPSL